MCYNPRANGRNVLWSYVLNQNHGPGPSPDPTSRHIHIYMNLKTLIYIYTTRNRWRCNGRRRFVKSLHSGGGLGVEPRGLPIILHTTNEPIPGCHVAAHDWATWHPIIAQKTATCRHLIRQCSTNQILATSLLCGRTVLPRQTVRTVKSTSKFFYLFDLTNRSLYLSLSTSV
jgi:hypothetical protein